MGEAILARTASEVSVAKYYREEIKISSTDLKENTFSLDVGFPPDVLLMERSAYSNVSRVISILSYADTEYGPFVFAYGSNTSGSGTYAKSTPIIGAGNTPTVTKTQTGFILSSGNYTVRVLDGTYTITAIKYT